eukprot:TRINITY_DN26578_c0_g1_i1.p1 TRINITY_DN26578_c0_g1~~TRINITY_DN26578_c0_g1_i1.p1  ORF type:complete len:386 (+),score=102.35 TRINITY_DN26578_c0_g1_i1:114-1271(+)
MWPSPAYGCGKGGKGYKARMQAIAAACSTESYVARHLREEDLDAFSAAALVPYRKTASGSIELLLTLEKPWNIFLKSYDAISLHVLGGKRIMSTETHPETTAIRCLRESLDVVPEQELPKTEELLALTEKALSVWYSAGRYAFLFAEVPDGMFDDLPEKFLKGKAAAPTLTEEFTINADGVKKWTKHMEAVEWVSVKELVPEVTRDCSDLTKNLVGIQKLVDVLTGEVKPEEEYPQVARPERSNVGFSGKFTGKGKSGKASKGFGKGFSKGTKAASAIPPRNMMLGKGMPPMAGMPPMMMPPTYGGFPPMAIPQKTHQEVQQQLYGEQLYVLIQPLVESTYIAQKITGMLLELPHNELLLNLTSPEELGRRVKEATALLAEDGLS